MSIMEIVRSISPLGLMDSVVGYMGFNVIHNSLNSVMERNMANNFTALFHAFGCTSLGLSCMLTKDTKLFYFLRKFSTGYFLYDVRHSAKHIKQPLSSAYMYHHLATIYYLHQDPIKYNIAQIIFFGELSNIPSYFVYYLIKKAKDKKQIAFAKKIQFYVYSFIRLPIATYLTYDVLRTVDNRIPVYAMLPVYLMGLIWTNSLWKKLKS